MKKLIIFKKLHRNMKEKVGKLDSEMKESRNVLEEKIKE